MNNHFANAATSTGNLNSFSLTREQLGARAALNSVLSDAGKGSETFSAESRNELLAFEITLAFTIASYAALPQSYVRDLFVERFGAAAINKALRTDLNARARKVARICAAIETKCRQSRRSKGR